MRKSLTASFILHTGILVAALVVLPNPKEFNVKLQDAVEVDISNLTDESKRKATTKSEVTPEKKIAPKKIEEVKKVEPAAKVAPEVKTAVKEAVPPPETPVKAPEPKKTETEPLDSDPLQALIEKVVDKPKEKPPKPVVKPEKKVEKKKEAEKKKPELKLDDIAAFLNKTDEEKTAPPKPSDNAATPELAATDAHGEDGELAATLADGLRQRLRQCWSVPAGAREADITVRVKFHLGIDGSVTGSPKILNPSNEPVFAATARSAVSAVLDCQPFDFLPRDRFDMWKDITINFNPDMMSGT